MRDERLIGRARCVSGFALVLSSVCGSDGVEFISSSQETWIQWKSGHPDPNLASRQQLEYQGEGGELTRGLWNLSGGLLRLAPWKELPTHFHPDGFDEIYYFTRGDGHVILDQHTDREATHSISSGLHVNIPARTLHAIQAGSEGCEFFWCFPATRWVDIPYLFIDPRLDHQNVGRDYRLPLPLAVSDQEAWAALQDRAEASSRRSERPSTVDTSYHRAHFIPQLKESWTFKEPQHPNRAVAVRHQREFKELTRGFGGLTGGLIRLAPFKELATHFHMEGLDEVYHVMRGNGHVIADEGTEREQRILIEKGLHVNIPGRTLHGVKAGSQGCEFLWMFPAARWTEVGYQYVDPELEPLHKDFVNATVLPIGFSTKGAWEAVKRNATGRLGRPEL